MRVVLLSAFCVLACGGRSIAEDATVDDPRAGSEGIGGARAAGGGSTSRAGSPAKGGTPGSAGARANGGASTAGASGGSWPGGGFAGVQQAGAAGGPMPEPGDCKAFCYQLDNLCNPAPVEKCFEQCQAALFDPNARCVQENVLSMRCAVRAASTLPPDRCIDSRDLLLKYCPSELAALQACQSGPIPMCQETSAASAGLCVLMRECGPRSQLLFECSGDPEKASCRCWTNGTLTFTVETSYPAEKACFDPMLTAACRPQGVF